MSQLPPPMPRALDKPAKPEVRSSPALSLFARPGDGGIQGRKVAILAANGVAGQSLLDIHAGLFAQGAVPRFVAPRIGPVKTADGVAIDADASLENEPGFLFDALVLPDGNEGVAALAKDGHTMEFIKDQYRHCKPILVLDASSALIDKAEVSPMLPSGGPDTGIVISNRDTVADLAAFVTAIARHRHPERETDPPLV